MPESLRMQLPKDVVPAANRHYQSGVQFTPCQKRLPAATPSLVGACQATLSDVASGFGLQRK